MTLAELMAVVVIVGILATLASVGYRRYINSARSSEAVHMVSAIRAAQESYRAETLQYLSVSAGGLTDYYPAAPAANTPAVKTSWGGGTGATANNWRVLNVTTDGPVYYGYATVAGLPGAAFPALEIDDDPTFPTPIEPWYVVQAKGNINGDSVFSYYVATSLTNAVYWENEGE